MQGIALSIKNGYNNSQILAGGIGFAVRIPERAG